MKFNQSLERKNEKVLRENKDKRERGREKVLIVMKIIVMQSFDFFMYVHVIYMCGHMYMS